MTSTAALAPSTTDANVEILTAVAPIGSSHRAMTEPEAREFLAGADMLVAVDYLPGIGYAVARY